MSLSARAVTARTSDHSLLIVGRVSHRTVILIESSQIDTTIFNPAGFTIPEYHCNSSTRSIIVPTISIGTGDDSSRRDDGFDNAADERA
jgi:hypothetical protein